MHFPNNFLIIPYVKYQKNHLTFKTPIFDQNVAHNINSLTHITSFSSFHYQQQHTKPHCLHFSVIIVASISRMPLPIIQFQTRMVLSMEKVIFSSLLPPYKLFLLSLLVWCESPNVNKGTGFVNGLKCIRFNGISICGVWWKKWWIWVFVADVQW